jgi:hypothetical protein
MTHSKKQMNAGYTIDQTILIIAIIAILITIIIATVGWDLLQRAGGAKVASHLRQVEGSIGEFYSRHQLWPHEALGLAVGVTTAGGISNQARILNDGTLGTDPSFVAADHKVALSSYGATGANTGLQHGLGAGGAGNMFLRTVTTCGGIAGDTYEINFTAMTQDEVERADASIDGAVDGTAGRLRYTGTINAVDVRFCANRF